MTGIIDGGWFQIDNKSKSVSTKILNYVLSKL